ncbi:CO/xanthine dehydrogenase FAD-binding subunit [Nitrobacteraceae bacterium AZCC 2161]
MESLVTHRSRYAISDFALLRPTSLREARAMLDAEPGATAMAGGLDIINRMKDGFAPPIVVALAGIEDFAAIGWSPERHAVTIGAGACHDALANSKLVHTHLPDLAQCWGLIANIRIRMQGTVVGNLLAEMPGYEGATLLSALGASLSYSSSTIAAESIQVAKMGHAYEAFRDFRPLVDRVTVPVPKSGITRRLVYERSLRPMLSVALQLDHADGKIINACVVLGGCHAWPVRFELPIAGDAMSHLDARAEIISRQAFARMPAPTVPWYGLAGYREQVAPVLLSRPIRGITS